MIASTRIALALVLAAAPALAQAPSEPAPRTGRNVAATGRTLPPPGPPPAKIDPAKIDSAKIDSAQTGAAKTGAGRSTPGKTDPSKTTAKFDEAAALKAQQAAAARNKAWDAKTKSTMGSICRGC